LRDLYSKQLEHIKRIEKGITDLLLSGP